MGFSLKAFFEELQRLIDNARTAEDLEEIRVFVADQKAYAETCGQLR